MTRDETSKYTDPLPDGTARQFSFVMDAKSIDHRTPAHPDRLHGAGLVGDHGARVERARHASRASTSAPTAARRWTAAELQEPVLPKAHTRFRHCGSGTGGDAVTHEPRRRRDRVRAADARRAARGARAGDGLSLQPHPRVGRGGRRRAWCSGCGTMTACATVRRRGSRRRLLAAGRVVASRGHASAPERSASGARRRRRRSALGPRRRARRSGLPAGRGTAAEGAVVYAAKCASCHGANGEGRLRRTCSSAASPRDAARSPPTRSSRRRSATTGRTRRRSTTTSPRAMPFCRPGTLTPDETYSPSRGSWPRTRSSRATAVMDASTLPAVGMPARDRFVVDNRTGGEDRQERGTVRAVRRVRNVH